MNYSKNIYFKEIGSLKCFYFDIRDEMKVNILVLIYILVFVVLAIAANKIMNTKWFRMKTVVREYEKHKRR